MSIVLFILFTGLAYLAIALGFCLVAMLLDVFVGGTRRWDIVPRFAMLWPLLIADLVIEAWSKVKK